MAFDPCREWLGIDAIDLADPRRVLGLPPHAIDGDAVRRAAAARLEALARITPGPFAKAHAALVNRVEEARERLLAEARAIAAVPPPPAAVPSGFRPPPPPADLADGAEPDEPDVPVAEADPIAPVAAVSIRPASLQRRSSGGGLLLGSIALLGAAAALLAVFVSQGGRQVALGPARPAERTVANGRSAGVAASSPEAGADVRRQDSEAREAAAARNREAEAERRRRGAEAEKARSAAAEAKRPATEEAKAAEASGMAEQERERAEQERERAEQERERAEQERQRVEQERAEQERVEQERATMASALDKALGQAYAAIQREEFDTALRAINAADKNVGDDVEAATRVERWRLFATYAKEFPAYQNQAFAAANAGREFEADGVRFAIIEIKPDLFVYKVAGRTERVPREAVDPRIAMAVVEGWFAGDGRAANHLFLGARWLSLSPPDVRRARREWQIAGDGGETVAPLMALLDDPVIRRAGR